MNEYAQKNLDAALDVTVEDDSRPELAPLWEALETPIYRVIDEEGVNVANGAIRRLDKRHWLYVDDTDGFSVVDDDDAENLLCVSENRHIPCGWDDQGNVIVL